MLVHGRDGERCRATVDEIRAASGNDRVHGYVADLSALANVRRLADEVTRDHERLDVLVNNAGTVSRERQESEDGYELTFAVNYLAHFLLTDRLLPLLRGSAPARIVSVASIGQAPIDFDDVMLERSYDPMRAYSQSKLAQIMFTFELAERLGSHADVTVNCLHPATLMNTKMVMSTLGRSTATVEEGAEATLQLICDPALDGTTGRYFDGLEESQPHPQAHDAGARRRLWQLSEELVGAARP